MHQRLRLASLLTFIAVLVLALCASRTEAADVAARCRVAPVARLQALDLVYRVEEFRVFYTLTGPDALRQQVDRDNNGVPDMVEDAGRQLLAARRAYTELMGFVHPFEQPRYQGVAKVIDVNVIPVRTGSTGLAYDEVVNGRRAIDGPMGACALRIDLDLRWTSENQTAAHELFHLFQNGYTMFKMPWLTEGTARWAESALGDNVPQQVALPDTVASRAALLASRYGTAGFWSTLAVQLDPKGGFAAPTWLQALHYANGKSVRGAAPVRGAEFIRHVFEAMGRADHAVARAQGWPIYNWSEADQKSPNNDTPAWTALMDVLRITPAPGVTVAALLAFDAAQPMAGVP